jgi:hypothetical protein
VIPRGLHTANETLAFLLELAALAALAWWGSTTGSSALVHLILGLGAPLTAMVTWALFAAPKARIKMPMAGVLAVKAIVFGAAAIALWEVGHEILAIAFAVTALANTTISASDRNALMNARRDRDSPA